jgi:hypothetical protein
MCRTSHLKSLSLYSLLICCVVVSDASAERQRRSVTARVSSASGSGVGIRAEKEPGHFTVPEGHYATDLKYSFHDPKSDYSSNRLSGSNIYSVALGKYISAAANNPSVRLPAGKYKFVVGGGPGASGTLSFDLVSTTTQPEAHPPATDRLGLPRSFDVSFSPLTDIYVTTPELGRRRWKDLPGALEHFRIPDAVVVRFRDGQFSADWTFEYSAPNTQMDHKIALTGSYAAGRFVGKETNSTQYRMVYDDGPLSWDNGSTWSLSGTADSGGLLVLHGKWESDRGQQPEFVSTGAGKGGWQFKPHDSGPNIAAVHTEMHLRLPVGRNSSHASRGSTEMRRTHDAPVDLPGSPSASDTANTVENTMEPGNLTTTGNSIWNTSVEDTPWDVPALPPKEDGPSTQPTDPNNIWSGDDHSTIDDLAEDDDESETFDDTNIDDPRNPKIGSRTSDGKIWYQPPWDEGGAYPMDEEEVAAIRERERQGFRWDKRHGWVNDDRQKEIDDIADIQRRSDAKTKKRSQDTADNLAASERKARTHGEKAKRAGDMALMNKAKALGWGALTDDERAQLGKADEDIKDHLRGDPKTIKGYERGFVDKNFSQSTIDTAHTVLQGTKVVIDETMNALETKTGPAGKAISKTYTIVSNVAESASQANADYRSGKKDSLDYDTAVTDGFKKGVTSVIVDEISGELNNHVTDRLLDSKVGKRAADYVEGEADQARKKVTRDFMSGKSDALNSRVLDDAAEGAAAKAKQNVNYAIGRTTKPGYDATVGQPVQDAVDWTIDTDVKKQSQEAPRQDPDGSEDD